MHQCALRPDPPHQRARPAHKKKRTLAEQIDKQLILLGFHYTHIGRYGPAAYKILSMCIASSSADKNIMRCTCQLLHIHRSSRFPYAHERARAILSRWYAAAYQMHKLCAICLWANATRHTVRAAHVACERTSILCFGSLGSSTFYCVVLLFGLCHLWCAVHHLVSFNCSPS